MSNNKQRQSAKWATLIILSMITVLSSVAIASGGFPELGGVLFTAVYCVLVAVPLILVTLVTWKKNSSSLSK